MVLCRFYLQGACRFGSKCHNEHVDIKSSVKLDMETALNGKQWPFSCYGPFRDSMNIPNFVLDQSMEEVRMLCYESKKRNCYEQFAEQFKKEALQAQQKMKTILQFQPDVMDMLTTVYNKTIEANAAAAANVNPFGSWNAGSGATTGGSIFSQSANNNSTSNSIFGNGGNTTSVFGGGGAINNNNTTSTVGKSLFGGGISAATPTNSIFGGGSTSTSTTTLFGQTTVTPMDGTSFFGNNNTTGATVATTTTNNIFNQNVNNGIVNPSPFAAMSSAPTSMFASQQPQQQSVGMFSQATPPNTFATQGQQQQQQQMMITGTPAPLVGFGVASQPAPQSMFDQVASTNNNNNIFAQQQQQQQPVAAGDNVFAQTMQQVTPNTLTSVYSRLEDLSAEELEAFKADSFQPGKIPFKPPPKELVY